jgi:hypothetical protein
VCPRWSIWLSLVVAVVVVLVVLVVEPVDFVLEPD